MTAEEFERVMAAYERVRQTQVEILIGLVLSSQEEPALRVAQQLATKAEQMVAIQIEHDRNPLMTLGDVFRMIGFVPDLGQGPIGFPLPQREDTRREPGPTIWERLLRGDEG